MKLQVSQHDIPMTRWLRPPLLRLMILSLSVTAALGITAVLWKGLDGTGTRLLYTAIEVDLASVLALSCSGLATSAFHRAAQLTGITSTFIILVSDISITWYPSLTSMPDSIRRALEVITILAIAAAHASLVLSWRSENPNKLLTRAVAPGTVLCTAIAAELVANYAMFPSFSPGSGYTNAIEVTLIVDALGTILTLLLHRFGPPRATALQATPHLAAPDPHE